MNYYYIIWERMKIFPQLPKYVSWFGIYSCISANSFAMSCESLVMLHNSSWLKSGVICLHNKIWLITFPKFDGPARLSENTMKMLCIVARMKKQIYWRNHNIDFGFDQVGNSIRDGLMFWYFSNMNSYKIRNASTWY